MVEKTNGSRRCVFLADEMTSGYRLHLHRHFLAIKACSFAFMFASSSVTVAAEVHVSGDVGAMSITASQSKISDILAALERDYKVQYRTSVALDAPVTAAYSGSLKEVLARVLAGYTYVIKQTETSAEVVVIGKKGDRAIVGAVTPSASPGKNLAAQWRATLNGETASPPQTHLQQCDLRSD